MGTISLRLGIHQKWKSHWFAEKQYSPSLKKDILLYEYGTRFFEKKNCLVGGFQIRRSLYQTDILFYVFPQKNYKGNFIYDLKKRKDFQQLNDFLTKINGFQVRLYCKDMSRVSFPLNLKGRLSRFKYRTFFHESFKVIQASLTYKNSCILAQYIANQIEKDNRHKDFIDFLKNNLSLHVDSFAPFQGFQIELKGRINKADRSQKILLKYGQVSHSTLNAFIDYWHAPAFTRYGVCGIRVWLSFLLLEDLKHFQKKNAATNRIEI